MTRFAFTVEFDGRPYMGWQRQAHGPSVQQAIETAIHAVTGEAAILHCAGRTDAGVHGLAMRAHADIEKPITPFRLGEALNATFLVFCKGPPTSLDSGDPGASWSIRLGKRDISRSAEGPKKLPTQLTLLLSLRCAPRSPSSSSTPPLVPSIATRCPPAEVPNTPMCLASRLYLPALPRIQRIAALQSWICEGQ